MKTEKAINKMVVKSLEKLLLILDEKLSVETDELEKIAIEDEIAYYNEQLTNLKKELGG